MTLAQTTERLLAAAGLEDLPSLEAALAERACVMAVLVPSEETRADIAASIEAGEKALCALRSIKLRARREHRKLAHLREELTQTLTQSLAPIGPHIDYRG
jgi:hypothetical protein